MLPISNFPESLDCPILLVLLAVMMREIRASSRPAANAALIHPELANIMELLPLVAALIYIQVRLSHGKRARLRCKAAHSATPWINRKPISASAQNAPTTIAQTATCAHV